MLDDTFYTKTVQMVIDNLEGGYYHPDMLLDGRVKDQRYKWSGETMFGLDRHAGHGYFYKGTQKSNDVRTNLQYIESGAYVYKNDASKKFWQVIDSANAKKLWKWNYMGGSLRPELQALAAQIMRPWWDYYAKTYFTAKARQIVESNDRLLFNFIYAMWNGPGWYKKWANLLNKEVEVTQDSSKLSQSVIKYRLNEPNSLLKQSGTKIQQIFDKYLPEKKN